MISNAPEGAPSITDPSPARAILLAFRHRLAHAARTTGKTVVDVAEIIGRVQVERPPNWPSGFVTLTRARPLLADGFPVVWVPDADTLTELLDARDRSERQRILMANADRVVAHAVGVLDEVTCPHLQEWRGLVLQAVGCVQAFPAPAQALALHGAVVIAADLHGVPNAGQVVAQAKRISSGDPIPSAGALRNDLTTVVFETVLARFNPGQPLPTTPNRHVAAHTLSEDQYTAANALEAVLLAVSVLRQLQAHHESRRCTSSIHETAMTPSPPKD